MPQTDTFNFEVVSRYDLEQADVAGFEAYHAANPAIYQALRRFALEAVRSGRSHFSINMLHERVRWYTTIEAKQDTFKADNNWRPFYARLLMAQEPELAGVFETRTAKADQ